MGSFTMRVKHAIGVNPTQRQYLRSQHLAPIASSGLKNDGRLPIEQHAAWQEFQQIQMRKLEMILDEGQGECLFAVPENRQVLADNLHYFERVRSELLAYVIMPNHAHILCRPLANYSLESLSRAWKRHSSDQLNRRLGRSGSLWQAESFDRIIRDADHYGRAVKYIAKNPSKARLKSQEATLWFNAQILQANPPAPPAS
ncbi:transposase [Prosthecobacter sp. SYSU 5D2]|uniref:transposase n=1 Tax=Prosthecobacter sp. SYSU 5D2 TaxID=3134134 RepID=UPI0031FEEC6B